MRKINQEFYIPRIDRNDHKYSRGKVIVVGGSSQFPGAAALSGMAAMRSGAGYGEVYAASSSVPIVQSFMPSLVVRPWADLEDDPLQSRWGAPCACLVGPGMVSDKKKTREILEYLLDNAKMPLVIDGGALGALASGKFEKKLHRRQLQGYPTILTPHKGEASRLYERCKKKQDEGDSKGKRVRDTRSVRGRHKAPGTDDLFEPNNVIVAARLARHYHAICVLKGPETVITDGVAYALVSDSTPALSKAGTGDVLAGVVATMLVRFESPFSAALIATRIHAHAGVYAAHRLGELCVCAEDVIDQLPTSITDYYQPRKRVILKN